MEESEQGVITVISVAIFWFCVALIFYTYIGYPLLVHWMGQVSQLAASRHRSDQVEGSPLPIVTAIVPAHNEERWIERKLENTLSLNYPRDRLQILVASDGSTDNTVEIAERFASHGVSVIHFPERAGKVSTLNRAVPAAKGEILLFTDANAILQPDALQYLIPHFQDPNVGCAGGNRICINSDASSNEGEGIYWRYEGWIRTSESLFYSGLGCYGQIFAVRRELYPYVRTVSDDFPIAMKILISTGGRTVFEPRAKALIPPAKTLRQEFERKIRSHVAFLFDITILKEGLIPGRTRIWWQFWSHHMFRPLVPIAMLIALAVSPWVWKANAAGRLAVSGELLFYVLSLIGFVLTLLGRRWRPAYVCFYFAFANVAMAVAWIRRFRGGSYHTWQRTERALPHVPGTAS